MRSKISNKYPASFAMLRLEVRKKAIEIANNLIQKEFDEEIAYAIAFINARQWTESYFKTGQPNRSLHIVPHMDGWGLITEDGSLLYLYENNKEEAIIRGREICKHEKVKLVIHAPSGLLQDFECFEVNRPRTQEQNLVTY